MCVRAASERGCNSVTRAACRSGSKPWRSSTAAIMVACSKRSQPPRRPLDQFGLEPLQVEPLQAYPAGHRNSQGDMSNVGVERSGERRIKVCASVGPCQFTRSKYAESRSRVFLVAFSNGLVAADAARPYRRKEIGFALGLKGQPPTGTGAGLSASRRRPGTLASQVCSPARFLCNVANGVADQSEGLKERMHLSGEGLIIILVVGGHCPDGWRARLYRATVSVSSATWLLALLALSHRRLASPSPRSSFRLRHYPEVSRSTPPSERLCSFSLCGS